MKRLLLCLLVFTCTFILWFICFANPLRFRKVHFFIAEDPARPFMQTLSSTDTGHNDNFDTLPMHGLSQGLEMSQYQRIEHPHFLTAILPITLSTLPNIEAVLSPFLRSSAHLREVIVVCPDAVVSETRRQLRRAVAAAGDHDHPDFSVRPWAHGTDQVTAVFRASSHVTTQWVLLLDDTGLQHLDDHTKDLLFGPRMTPFSVSFSGMDFWRPNVSCTATLHSESPFLPPFVIPTALLLNHTARSGRDLWVHLRGRLLEWLLVGSQGNVTSLTQLESGWCFPVTDRSSSVLNDTKAFEKFQAGIGDDVAHTFTPPYHPQAGSKSGLLVLLLPCLKDLELMSSIPCQLLSKGYQVRILLTKEVSLKEHILLSGGCHLDYDSLPSEISPSTSSRYGESLFLEWLDKLHSWPNVIFTLTEDRLTMDLVPTLQRHRASSTVAVVRIPRADLPYCFWMGTLSVEEWKNWNVPRIDISVITKDRPHSLRRLLSSLSNGRYFGDTLTFRVNLEQSSDMETIETVENFHWEHGDVFVHHRVVHGGLLPAVVESWYPQSNHTYGLLLEDDVELSPLFYAWIKMSILRYRYGEDVNKSPQLFGISLYQQKIIELRPEGRRPFDARALFSDQLSYPTCPRYHAAGELYS